jgi:hypothetical protein
MSGSVRCTPEQLGEFIGGVVEHLRRMPAPANVILWSK